MVQSEGTGGTHANPLGLSVFRGEIELEKIEREKSERTD